MEGEGLPYCTTCQKAVAYLEERGVTVQNFRDVKTQPLTRAELEELARRVGGAEKLFSKRAMKYRKMGLHEQQLSGDDLLRHMTEEYTFITRPCDRPRRPRDGGVLGQAGGRADWMTTPDPPR